MPEYRSKILEVGASLIAGSMGLFPGLVIGRTISDEPVYSIAGMAIGIAITTGSAYVAGNLNKNATLSD